MTNDIIRVNVTNQVIQYLKDRILKRYWAPGDKISSENELTQELKVSRSTVRSAIQYLIGIGVLENFQGKGTYLKSTMMEDIEQKFEKMNYNIDIIQLLEYRKIIEVESCRLAAKRRTSECLDNMKKYLSNMEENIQNSELFIKNDMAFHHEILKATGNKIIIQSMEYIRKEIENQHHRFNTKIGVSKAIFYHKAILEAMIEENSREAAKQMSEHLSELYNAYYVHPIS